MFLNFTNDKIAYHSYISKDFNFWTFYHFLWIFLPLKKAIQGGGEWTFSKITFSPGSCHEPGLKIDPLVPVDDMNRNQCSVARHVADAGHYSRALPLTGTNK